MHIHMYSLNRKRSHIHNNMKWFEWDKKDKGDEGGWAWAGDVKRSPFTEQPLVPMSTF